MALSLPPLTTRPRLFCCLFLFGCCCCCLLPCVSFFFFFFFFLLLQERLAALVKKTNGVDVRTDALFDVQVKRIHEYKRQLMNCLYVAFLSPSFSSLLAACCLSWPRMRACSARQTHRMVFFRPMLPPSSFHRWCIHRYQTLKAMTPEERATVVPRVSFIGGKAAPGYDTAKRIIRLINAVGDVINNDAETNDLFKLLFIPNYNVSTAEIIIPASDLSEHISTAGMEASGTSNMKFAMNGGLIIGTMDGANIEIAADIGEDNMCVVNPSYFLVFLFSSSFPMAMVLTVCVCDTRFIFGASAEQVPRLRMDVRCVSACGRSCARLVLFDIQESRMLTCMCLCVVLVVSCLSQFQPGRADEHRPREGVGCPACWTVRAGGVGGADSAPACPRERLLSRGCRLRVLCVLRRGLDVMWGAADVFGLILTVAPSLSFLWPCLCVTAACVVPTFVRSFAQMPRHRSLWMSATATLLSGRAAPFCQRLVWASSAPIERTCPASFVTQHTRTHVAACTPGTEKRGSVS